MTNELVVFCDGYGRPEDALTLIDHSHAQLAST
jgi:hypothetical protein